MHPRILAAAPDAPIVVKTEADSFFATTLASTLAGRLALGEELVSAVRSALDYTWRTLRDAEQLGHGQYVPRRLPLDLA